MSRRPRTRWIACIVIVLSTCLTGTPASSRTWRVRADFSGDAPTIPAALDSAQSGDEIVLGAGTYSWSTQGNDEHSSDPSMLLITRAITLRGESGAEQTILDAEEQGRVIRCVGAGAVRIEDVTLTGGAAQGAGAGLWSVAGTQPHITRCIVRDNQSGARAPGGGVSCVDGEVRETLFRNNTTGVSGFGGGLHCEATLVLGCTFTRNVAVGGDAGGGAGGGLWGDAAEVVECTFDSNTARSMFAAAGGGLYEIGLGSVRSCTFVGNVARGTLNQGFGGGLYAFSSTRIATSLFIGNVAERDGGTGLGGGVYGRLESAVVRCTVLANSSGVHLDAGATVEASIIAWNTESACTGSGTWSCSNLFGNGGGNVVCGTSAGGNFSADPQFCALDPAATLHVELQSDSPCAPGKHPQGSACGTIGAAPVGCQDVSATSTNWGHVKSLYR